ncbi:hypothetical protein CXR04_15955 [Streptomyces sp. CMB-StM0423]|nr:hypothetical protein CXR04_15955 [Streptomyces sp. CMB-StM0423]
MMWAGVGEAARTLPWQLDPSRAARGNPHPDRAGRVCRTRTHHVARGRVAGPRDHHGSRIRGGPLDVVPCGHRRCGGQDVQRGPGRLHDLFPGRVVGPAGGGFVGRCAQDRGHSERRAARRERSSRRRTPCSAEASRWGRGCREVPD